MRDKYSTSEGQKMLMAISMGLDEDTYTRKIIKVIKGEDYGFDPAGPGVVRLVPSGRIVTIAEAKEILKLK